jgi:hypothetical protein
LITPVAGWQKTADKETLVVHGRDDKVIPLKSLTAGTRNRDVGLFYGEGYSVVNTSDTPSAPKDVSSAQPPSPTGPKARLMPPLSSAMARC